MGRVAYQRLNFVRQPGDRLTANRVPLGGRTQTFSLAVWWRPLPDRFPQDEVTGAWFLDMSTTRGVAIVTGAPIRDRTDCLLGISTEGRPAGAIIAYDPRAREALTASAWTTDGVLLLYLPDGFIPADFSLY